MEKKIIIDEKEKEQLEMIFRLGANKLIEINEDICIATNDDFDEVDDIVEDIKNLAEKLKIDIDL